MSDTVGARRLPFRALGRIGVAPGNAAARHAAHWLRLLGGGEPATAATADIVIAGTGLDSDHREPECLIRLWDFQVGRSGGGVLASAVSGASAVIGRADGLPLPLPAEMPEKWCGLYGVILALAELWRRPVPGVAPRVVHDVSAADVIRAFALQNSGGPEEMRRSWRRNGRLCVDHGGIFPMGFFACRDGHVAILGRSRRDWRNIRQAIGDPEWARGPEFEDPFAIARK